LLASLIGQHLSKQTPARPGKSLRGGPSVSGLRLTAGMRRSAELRETAKNLQSMIADLDGELFDRRERDTVADLLGQDLRALPEIRHGN